LVWISMINTNVDRYVNGNEEKYYDSSTKKK
jgi:hypothetical protein